MPAALGVVLLLMAATVEGWRLLSRHLPPWPLAGLRLGLTAAVLALLPILDVAAYVNPEVRRSWASWCAWPAACCLLPGLGRRRPELAALPSCCEAQAPRPLPSHWPSAPVHSLLLAGLLWAPLLRPRAAVPTA